MFVYRKSAVASGMQKEVTCNAVSLLFSQQDISRFGFSGFSHRTPIGCCEVYRVAKTYKLRMLKNHEDIFQWPKIRDQGWYWNWVQKLGEEIEWEIRVTWSKKHNERRDVYRWERESVSWISRSDTPRHHNSSIKTAPWFWNHGENQA